MHSRTKLIIPCRGGKNKSPSETNSALSVQFVCAIPACRRLMQEDHCKFNGSLGYRVRLYPKRKKLVVLWTKGKKGDNLILKRSLA